MREITCLAEYWLGSQDVLCSLEWTSKWMSERLSRIHKDMEANSLVLSEGTHLNFIYGDEKKQR